MWLTTKGEVDVGEQTSGPVFALSYGTSGGVVLVLDVPLCILKRDPGVDAGRKGGRDMLDSADVRKGNSPGGRAR